MATLAELQQYRQRLQDARYSGVRRVRDQNGEEIEYKSDSEIAKALSALEAEISAASRKSSNIIRFQTSKGVRPMKNYVQKGETLTIPAPYAVASGGGVKSGLLFGVASGAAEAAADVDLVTVGVFDLTKVAANSFAVGAAVYWDDAAKLATSTTSGNTKIGAAVAAAAADTAAVRVRLNGTF